MKKKDQNRKRNYLHKMCCYILHISSELKLDFWNEKRQSHKLHVVDKKKLFIVTMAANLNLDENLTFAACNNSGINNFVFPLFEVVVIVSAVRLLEWLVDYLAVKPFFFFTYKHGCIRLFEVVF